MEKRLGQGLYPIVFIYDGDGSLQKLLRWVCHHRKHVMCHVCQDNIGYDQATYYWM